MKWIIIIVILLTVLGFYIVIKRQNDYNIEEENRNKILNNVANFGSANIQSISSQKVSIVDKALDSPIVSGIIKVFTIL